MTQQAFYETVQRQEEHMNVYAKLNEARARFHQLKLSKSGKNTFAGYSYFELGDFIIPAMEVFSAVGLCAFVSFEGDTAVMRVVDVDKPQDVITIMSPMSSAALKGCHPVQNIGAVETYQRRYLWVAALEIVEHDALDATTGKGKGPIADSFRSSPTMGEMDRLDTDMQIYLRDLADELGQMDAAQALDRLNAENLDDTQKPALWGMLGAKLRGEIKKLQQAK